MCPPRKCVCMFVDTHVDRDKARIDEVRHWWAIGKFFSCAAPLWSPLYIHIRRQRILARPHNIFSINIAYPQNSTHKWYRSCVEQRISAFLKQMHIARKSYIALFSRARCVSVNIVNMSVCFNVTPPEPFAHHLNRKYALSMLLSIRFASVHIDHTENKPTTRVYKHFHSGPTRDYRTLMLDIRTSMMTYMPPHVCTCVCKCVTIW